MQISLKKLMKIIREFRREFYGDLCIDDYEEYDDCDDTLAEIELFDNQEWAQIEKKINDERKKNPQNYNINNNATDKEKRIAILCSGIENRMNIDQVNAELKRANLKEVYPRCYNELILYWCFTNNKQNKSYIVGAKEYGYIKRECDKFIEVYRELMERNDFNNSFHDKVTLRKLKDYINNNSKDAVGKHIEEAITNTVTLNIKNHIKNEDMSNINEMELVHKIIGQLGQKNTLGQLTQRCEKTRYYFIKLLVKFIEAQIQEFIDILKMDISNVTSKRFLEKVYDEEFRDIAPWSIRYAYYMQIRSEYPKLEQLLEKDNENTDTQKNKKKKHTVTSKVLDVLGEVMFFEGKPLDDCNVSELFKNADGTVKSWSAIREIGYVFKYDEIKRMDKDYAENKAKYINKKQLIDSLSIDNFLDYPIKTMTLANIIFKNALDMSGKEYNTENNLKERFSKALQGKVEISRDVFLYVIMIINQAMRYYNGNTTWLDIVRINDILTKIGFDRIPDEKEIKKENIDNIEKCLMDHIVKCSLNMKFIDFRDSIIDLFIMIQDKEGSNVMIEMQADALNVYEKNIDRRLM